MLKKISFLFGKFASKEFNPFIQNIINRIYIKVFNINLDEFSPIYKYKSLNALFTRRLKKNRGIAKELIISPADSRVISSGKLENNYIFQIKGREYDIKELIPNAKELRNAYFVNLYLSPKDYHRFHSPNDFKLISINHIVGNLYPVNKPSLLSIDRLFPKNERVILELEDENGNKCYFVAVGALNVGGIVIKNEQKIMTNIQKIDSFFSYNDIFIGKGEEIGFFKMGSSIVLIYENRIFNTRDNKKVTFGEAIGYMDAK